MCPVVLVAGAALGKDAGIEQVHVGGGDVLHRDQTFQLVVRCRHRQGVDLAVAHDLPRLAQAGGAGDAGHFAVVHIPDLGVDVRAHARGPDPEFFEHELGLLIHFACTAGFADQITGLVFQFCIGDGRADGVGVRIAMSDNNDLMGCFGHIVPPLGPGFPSMLISFTMVHSPAPAQRGAPQIYFSTIACTGKAEQTRCGVAFGSRTRRCAMLIKAASPICCIHLL